jgi:hypothetical protein
LLTFDPASALSRLSFKTARRPIRTYPAGQEFPSIDTREHRSRDDAIKAGKDLVDKIEKGVDEMKE